MSAMIKIRNYTRAGLEFLFVSYSGVCSIASGQDSIPEFAKKIELLNNKIFWIVVFIIAIIYIFIRITSHIMEKICINIGCRGIPCSKQRLLTRYRIRNYGILFNVLHTDILHSKYKLISDCEINNCTLPEFQDKLDDILVKINSTLKMLTNVDFSICIKLFSEEDNKLIAYTLKRYPNDEERKKINSQSIPSRRSSDNFEIKAIQNNAIEERFHEINSHLSKMTNNSDGQKYNGRNLAYDYVISETCHYWLSNDLSADKNNCNFSCTNEHEPFYNSLGVFLIAPPIKWGKKAENGEAVGLLTIDSSKTHIFIEDETKYIVGFISHILYDIFNTVKFKQ